jgi:CheY-like chemotaxis protein
MWKFVKQSSSRLHRLSSKESVDKKEYSQKHEDEIQTKFLRNVSRMMETNMLGNLSPMARKMENMDMSDTNLSDFVKKLFTIGKEYNDKLNGISDYYDILAGKKENIYGPILIRNIISYAYNEAKNKVKYLYDNDINPIVNVSISENVPISQLIGDGPTMICILQELIYNGLRHDENTHISIFISKTNSENCPDGIIDIEFKIKDNGCLINNDNIDDIFKPFNQSNSGIAKGSGVGIGLATCKLCSSNIGGELTVSVLDGTFFTLRVPLKYDSPLEYPNGSLNVSYKRNYSDDNLDNMSDEIKKYCYNDEVEPSKPSVLVVDDSVLVLKQFQKSLELLQIDVDICLDPVISLDMVISKKYDIICLDIIMPVMSGITCAENIRSGSSINNNTPIIFITADSSMSTRKLTSFVKNSMVLEKPARRDVLFRTLITLIQEEGKIEWIKRCFEILSQDKHNKIKIVN